MRPGFGMHASHDDLRELERIEVRYVAATGGAA